MTSAILFIISKRQQQSSDSLHAAKKKFNDWRQRPPPKNTRGRNQPFKCVNFISFLKFSPFIWVSRHGKEKGHTLQEQVDVVDVQGDGAPVLIVISGVQVRQHASSLAASCQHGTSARHGWDKQTSLSCRATTWPELKGPQRTAARKVNPPRSNSRRGKHGQTPVWALEVQSEVLWLTSRVTATVCHVCQCLVDHANTSHTT